MYYLCEKYCKPTIVLHYVADCVSWVPRLTLLGLWTIGHALEIEQNLLYFQIGQFHRSWGLELECIILVDIIQSTAIFWRRQWHPPPVLLPGKSHGQRSLVGWSPWGHEESDRTEWLHFHVSLSWIGEGNGNPLQCSCLENPRYGGAWWAAVYGVAQSRAWLKWLSSSSSSGIYGLPWWLRW